MLYFDDLSDDENAYLRSQRAAICRRITDLTGLVPEIREEGLAMVDFDDDLSDVRMPEKGTEGHVTLLIAEHLARSGEVSHTVDGLVSLVQSLAPRYRQVLAGGRARAGRRIRSSWTSRSLDSPPSASWPGMRKPSSYFRH